MEHEFEDYPALEWTPNDKSIGPSDLGSELISGPCWQISAFGICVERWQNDRLTLGFYLAGVKVGQKTIDANDPCVKFKADAGIAQVKVEVCIDFGKRVVVARGEVCVTFACVRFNQTIFNF